MIKGLRNLLGEASAMKVRRFVHLSSVLVYGDPPPKESAEEGCGAMPVEGTYGAMKALQDRLVAKAAADGLSSAILCPPNIGGPGSYFLLGVARAISDGSFALLDGEAGACALVDVDNLCDAIELALAREVVPSTRLFVTDREMLSWREVVRLMADGLGLAMPEASVSRSAVAEDWQLRNVPPERPSLGATLRYIGSSRVRGVLREDPLLGRMESAIKRFIRQVRPTAEDSLLQALDGPAPVVSHDPLAGLARPYLYQQLRTVYHSPRAANVALGYVPKVSSAESVMHFCRWFVAMSGWSGHDFSDLARIASDSSLRGAVALSGCAANA